MKRHFRIFSLFVGIFLLVFWAAPSRPSGSRVDEIKKRGYLLWGSDSEGGAPYVFPDPNDPSKLIGFEVDLADAIARELGVKARQSQNAWDSLIPALDRGDFDMAMNGIEITPQRQSRLSRRSVQLDRPIEQVDEQQTIRQPGQPIRHFCVGHIGERPGEAGDRSVTVPDHRATAAHPPGSSLVKNPMFAFVVSGCTGQIGTPAIPARSVVS